MGKLLYVLKQYSQRLWFLPSLLSTAVLLWIVLAFAIDRNWSWEPPFTIEREMLMGLFTILSSTMLTVATFAVSAISSAIAGIANSATPRATRVVLEKNRMRSTMAAFLATFIFAVVSIITLSATHFSESGRLVLFIGFVVLVGWVLIAFLQWVEDITNFGKPEDTIQRVHTRACEIISDSKTARHMGCRPLQSGDENNDFAIYSEAFGAVSYIAFDDLQKLAEELQGNLDLHFRPGDFAHPRAPLMSWRGPELSDEQINLIKACVLIEHQESAQQNPRYAIRLLTEIADRALSPGVNDPGTAITVISRQVELLERWAQNELNSKSYEVLYPRLHAPALAALDLFQDTFLPIARDGAGQIEVVLKVIKALRILSKATHPDYAAASQSLLDETVELSMAALGTEAQKKRVMAAASE